MDETAVSDFYNDAVDVKQAQETYKRNQPPAGAYVSLLESYEPTITPVVFEGDTRKLFGVFVRAGQLQKKTGETVEQGLRFRFSAETRPATKFGTGEVIEGKDDAASKRYAELVKAYLDWAGEDGEPLKTIGQLIDFIKQVPLTFNTMNGDNGLQVTGVSYKKSR